MMAKPISFIHKRVLTEEDKKEQSINHLTDDVAENEEALKKTLAIVRELHDSGILEAVESMLKAKGKITEIVLGQATRKEVTNIINNGMAAAGVLTELDPEQTKKLMTGVVNGLKEAKENQGKKVGVFDLMKALKDPDLNRAVGFGVNFLKGLGKGLKE
jgi:uncharacterized protein YjgD (DUF1641 family)